MLTEQYMLQLIYLITLKTTNIALHIYQALNTEQCLWPNKTFQDNRNFVSRVLYKALGLSNG